MRLAEGACAGFALWLASGSAAYGQDLCAQALAAVPGRACAANPHGVVLSPEQAEADRIAAAVRDAGFPRRGGNRLATQILSRSRAAPPEPQGQARRDARHPTHRISFPLVVLTTFVVAS